MIDKIAPFDVAAVLVFCAASFGWLNHRFFGLPLTTGLTTMGATASALIVVLDNFAFGPADHQLRRFIADIDFRAALMEGMLSFLLFAGALQVDLSDLRRSKWATGIITVVGVLASTAIVGVGAWAAGMAFGIDIPLLWCLLFGALISPTDPVAVLGILKSARVPALLEATVAGESLFNDGVGIVVFSILVGLAAEQGHATLSEAARLFAVEAVGGVALGALAGGVAFLALRSIDEHNLEVMITVALVMATYSLARHIGTSGPIATAVAGLIIGNHGRALAMSDVTRDYLNKFWSLVDEILNAMLFLMIGLEIILVIESPGLLVIGLAAVPLVLFARALSVGLPVLALKPWLTISRDFYAVLVLGSMRGGISIALALSLPAGSQKPMVVAATYVVVLVSVLVQGPCVGLVARRLFPAGVKTHA
jgi:CPA1 family monovalent cation:H+ antiporter